MVERSKSPGRIEFYNPERGYGFINSMADGTRHFFHITSVLGNNTKPEVGRIVLFLPAESAKGKIALSVEVPL